MRTMKAVLLWAVVLSLAAIATQPAGAAPRAQSVGEYRWLWDVALTARAQAMEGVPVETTRRVITRIFEIPNDRIGAIVAAVIDAAHGIPWTADEAAGEFARRIGNACVANAGDLDGVLGTRL